MVRVQNARSHRLRATTSTFSTRVRPGGSIRSTRHCTRRASRCRSSTSSTGQTFAGWVKHWAANKPWFDSP